MKMYTTKQAADELGVKRITVLKAIDKGRLTANKMGPIWVVFEDKKFRTFKPGKAGRGGVKSDVPSAVARW